jgi:hypothetical protein
VHAISALAGMAYLSVMAAAAVLAARIVWEQTHYKDKKPGGGMSNSTETTSVPSASASAQDDPIVLAADNDTGAFTQLPGSLRDESADGAILQVRLQRGALVRFGLPVDAERAAEWVNVDFLVGEDGQPQGVRLHQDVQTEAVTQ